MRETYRVALVGNPNCGKTTLFNLLTGENQHVGNWSGVTVDKRSGTVDTQRFGCKRVLLFELVDLPGVYSLNAYSPEERVTRDYLTKEHPDLVVNIIDAGSLERSLYLTLQLLSLGHPMIVAMNMMDELPAKGIEVNIAKLSSLLDLPVVGVSAKKEEGIDTLVQQTADIACKKQKSHAVLFYNETVERTVQSVSSLCEQQTMLPVRYTAEQLLSRDKDMLKTIHFTSSERNQYETLVSRMEEGIGMEGAAILADQRYRWIEKALQISTIRHEQKNGHPSVSDRIDKIVCHPICAFPLVLLCLCAVFWVAFGPWSECLSEAFSSWIDRLTLKAEMMMTGAGIELWLRELISRGILRGISGVLSFLPTLILLFFSLSLLEDSGFLVRAAFVLDMPMRKAGLSGHCVIPMLMGCGCTVPAVMTTRSIKSNSERRRLIYLLPLMSCGAKISVYAFFAWALFDNHRLMIVSAMYLAGILLSAAGGILVNHTDRQASSTPFIMELPPYRMPSLRNVWRNMRDKVKEFFHRVFSVVLISSMAVWFLQSYNLYFQPVEDVRASMLGSMSGIIAPLLKPCGIDKPEAAAALMTGMLAKENVISTLMVMKGARGEQHGTLEAMRTLFPSTLSAASMLTFLLLYPPCFAALAALRRELGSWRSVSFLAIMQLGTAWFFSTLVYQAGRLLGL